MAEQHSSDVDSDSSKHTGSSGAEGQPHEAEEPHKPSAEATSEQAPPERSYTSGTCRHPRCLTKAKQSMCGLVQYCMAHMREHGQQPSAPRCQVDGCTKYAQQSIDRQRIYCVRHMRTKGMESAAAVCQQEGCCKEAKISIDGHRVFCILHMKRHGLQPRIASCAHPSCTKQAQPSREGPATYCKAHMRAHNLQPRVPLCQHDGCTKVAKQAQSGTMLYCILHMKERGLPVKATCSQTGCTRFARLSAQGTYAYCEQHMRDHGVAAAPTSTAPRRGYTSPAAAAPSPSDPAAPPQLPPPIPAAASSPAGKGERGANSSQGTRLGPAVAAGAQPRARRSSDPPPHPPPAGWHLQLADPAHAPRQLHAAPPTDWPLAMDPTWLPTHPPPSKRLKPSPQLPGEEHRYAAARFAGELPPPGSWLTIPDDASNDQAAGAPVPGFFPYSQYGPSVPHPSQRLVGQFAGPGAVPMHYMHHQPSMEGGGWMPFPMQGHPLVHPHHLQYYPNYADPAVGMGGAQYAGLDPYMLSMVLSPHADAALLPRTTSALLPLPELLSQQQQQQQQQQQYHQQHHHHQQMHQQRQQQEQLLLLLHQHGSSPPPEPSTLTAPRPLPQLSPLPPDAIPLPAMQAAASRQPAAAPSTAQAQQGAAAVAAAAAAAAAAARQAPAGGGGQQHSEAAGAAAARADLGREALEACGAEPQQEGRELLVAAPSLCKTITLFGTTIVVDPRDQERR